MTRHIWEGRRCRFCGLVKAGNGYQRWEAPANAIGKLAGLAFITVYDRAGPCPRSIEVERGA